MTAVFRGWLREPLVHFLLAGLAVFLLAAWRGEEVDPASRTIAVNADQVARLSATWQQTWQRPPTREELDGLIRDHIKEEVYYREAKRLGLDEDDAIIRRRLRSKMAFLASAEAESAAPGDAELQAWLDRSPARYAADTAYSFDQIYLGPDGPEAVKKAAAIIDSLKTFENWMMLGERISLPAFREKASAKDIARDFGDEFSAALSGMKPGDWTGPVPSGFGAHLVRLRAVRAAAPPKLADVRQAVENDWRAATQKEREERAFKTLLDGYAVTIATP